MNKKKYSSSIKKTPFKYLISKKIAKLMLEENDKSIIFNKCINDNYVEIISEERRREVTRTIYDRLCKLDHFLLKGLVDSDINTSKFILVYAILKSDLLFYDFMYEIYRDALLGDKKYISLDDFEYFFNSKKQQNIVVSNWGKYTIDQLSKGYRNILVESNLGIRNKKNVFINKIIVHPDIVEHIKQIGDSNYIQIVLGDE